MQIQRISVKYGSYTKVAGSLAIVIFRDNESVFLQTFDAGGTERLVAYPVVMWLIALGRYLLAVSPLARAKEVK
ncbi:MAG: hypothetical protein AB1351_04570 [Thermoproteota archaeon]